VSAAPPLIELRGAGRVYRRGAGEVAALRGVDLTVAAGESLAITGPSGSGKSTLLSLLGCLDRPSFGDYRLGQASVGELDDHALSRLRNRTIGFVFQSFQLLGRTTALDNVALPLVYRGVRRAERRERAEAALTAVGLGHRLGHRPGQLSGGEQQRVAIARALVGEPGLLLADEPTGNLDTGSGAEIMALLDGLVRDHGVAVVVVTHDPDVAALARRRVRMRDGLIQ
jgi:putative ABC transport system ATP-binding protein